MTAMRSAKWVKAAECEDERAALVCGRCSGSEKPLEPAREVRVHGPDTSCCLCDGGFLSRVAKLLSPARDDRNELEPVVQLFRIARMTAPEPLPGLFPPQVVDCRQIVDLGKDPVQAENCLAGLEFWFRAELLDLEDDDGTGTDTGTLLFHDPVTRMVAVEWACNCDRYFDLACYASLEEAAKVEKVLQGFRKRRPLPDSINPLDSLGLTKTGSIACSKFSLCLLQVCQLGARCITRCPSIRAFGEEDTAAARFGTLA